MCGVGMRPGAFVLEEWPPPETTPEGWALVNVAAVGICGTEYHILAGGTRFCSIPG